MLNFIYNRTTTATESADMVEMLPPTLESATELKSEITAVLNRASTDYFKGYSNLVGNYAMYYASLGLKSRLTWDIQNICQKYLAQLDKAEKTLSQDNFDHIKSMREDFYREMNAAMQKHPSSCNARYIDGSLFGAFYSNSQGKAESADKEKIAKYTYK